MIKPTVGRIVYFHSGGCSTGNLSAFNGPLAAIITHVWTDTMVNLAVFDPNGQSHGVTSVDLCQSDEGAKTFKDEGVMFCEWMPYQKGQAAKAEQLESELANNRQGE